MARKNRINEAGFHHIYNRGVERRDIFLNNKDKEKFLDIVCEIALYYDFTIHSYALMNNHYHLILENKRDNLSDGMRRINSSYAQYFNKKYKRVGHLWQDRFKSWYILNENYLFTLFRYIESNPIKAKLSKNFGEYRYTLLGDIANGSIRECMRDSFIFNLYSDTKELLDALDISISKTEEDKIKKIQMESNTYKKSSERIMKKRNIKDYFKKNMTKFTRNEAIKKAYLEGFTQSEIAKELNLSISTISKIIKNSKFKP